MGCVDPALLDEPRTVTAKPARIRDSRAGRGTECANNGQPPDVGRIAWLELAEYRVPGRRPFDAGRANPDNRTRN